MTHILAQLPASTPQSANDWLSMFFWIVGIIGAVIVVIYQVMGYHRRQPPIEAQFVAKQTHEAEIERINKRLSDGSELFATKDDIKEIKTSQANFHAELSRSLADRLSGISAKIDGRNAELKTDLRLMIAANNEAGEKRVTRLETRLEAIDESRQSDAKQAIREIGELTGVVKQALRQKEPA